MGGEGHWVALVRERDQNGEIQYTGYDSFYVSGGLDRFRASIRILEEIFQNTFPVMKEAYNSAVGEAFARKAKWFGIDGSLKDPQNRESLLGHQRNTYIERIIQSFRFMQRAGWLLSDDAEIIAHRRNLAVFANFFSQNVANEGLNKIREELIKLQG